MPDRVAVDVEGRVLRLSSLDKVMYPDGFTKAEVLDYYSRIAPVLLPHLSGRPLTRIRFPHGAARESFFEKNAPAGRPDWVPTVTVGDVEYPLVEDLATLVWLANLNALELHVPQWRTADPEHPDRLVIDLDPGPPAGLAECFAVALRLRDRLAADGLVALPKTSGRKGMQLMAALPGDRTSDEVSGYVLAVAQELERETPGDVVSRMAKALRPGKVFIDWSQNNAAKTTVAPYSLRATEHPTVSTPFGWDEEPRLWTAPEVLDRVASDGDLYAPLLARRPTRRSRTRRSTARDPAEDLRAIAFALERSGEGSYRVQAFRQAADTVAGLGATALAAHLAAGTLTHVPGIGAVTAACVAESIAGQEPSYLRRISAPEPTALRAELRGDCHSHTSWSDGSHSVEEMAVAAMELGHEYLAVTDHSPRLTIARGLSAVRLAEQLDVIGAVNRVLGRRMRVLAGIEVDILADGTLDQAGDLLDRLDVVVASVHSGLREASPRMTRRMLRAVRDPRVNILGHCTGRLRSERGNRPESAFDAEAVFAACAEHQVAVEINSRPERLDPPSRLLKVAVDAGCLFSIDSDAHAPGQLDWLDNGCARAERAGVPTDRIVNSWPVGRLLRWSRRLR
ncbi:hypothetical protein Lfu02_09440 [Longispora fulva]|uniref:DNA ligase D-like protein (Predicted polymerase) n=1 Tax=Longispora fulva TaxID=619741 RepID=A0A8J7GP03_9ACTN|nr:DNA ligase D-like protein (predicted polymerase) [Longispora fulva]GIG56572.1 hypothetical protein Lfu02_09440 [Longispora fulva]